MSFFTTECTSQVNTAKVVKVIDEDLIPAVFTREKTVIELDLKAIKQAWDDGQPVPGTELVDNTYLKYEELGMKTIQGEKNEDVGTD